MEKLDEERSRDRVMKCPESHSPFWVDDFDHDQAPEFADRTRRAIFKVGIGAVVGIGWRGWLADSEQIAAQLQVSSTEAVGQKAELADADQTGRQHVQ